MENIDKSQYTPMMRQYLTIKEDYSDAIVFFRLGDFYEMFFSDALLASKELEIALTARDAGAKERVPMCGVPHHAATQYIERLVEKGYKVAICEQIEDVSEAKGIVKRDVVQLITPGTKMDSSYLEEKNNNYLVSISEYHDTFIIAYSDLTTGENYITSLPYDVDLLLSEIQNISTKEIIVSSKFNKKILEKYTNVYDITISIHNDLGCPSYLKYLFNDIYIKGLVDTFSRLLSYLVKTQKRELMHLQKLVQYESSSYLRIDNYSRRNLELVETLRLNSRKGSLLWLLDKCHTAMGSRYLKKTIIRPLIDCKSINARYDFIDALHSDFITMSDLTESLKLIYDLERIVGRISYGNCNAKDLIQLKTSLLQIPKIKSSIGKLGNKLSNKYYKEINELSNLVNLLTGSIVDNPPISIKEGGIIKNGYNSELDEILNASRDGKDWLIKFEMAERERTGIKKLKVGYNRVFGYYIDIPRSQTSFIKEEYGYVRKQTLSNNERYISSALKEKESLILGSDELSVKLEYSLFLKIRENCKNYISDLQDLAKIISEVDMLLSFAKISNDNHYNRPTISEESDIEIIDGRHAVVEKVLTDSKFVENSTFFNENLDILLLTGPNMSGKSTYMRQVALITILAQMGCFVPCTKARLKIHDQIFTRIGAADDLVSGQSTFMVEMLETNNALANATKNSLVLFDEIGRGTSTYDGLALAQAIIEYVHEKINCKMIFSTHYHELTDLEKTLKRLTNIHVTADEQKGKIIFLHKIVTGPSDKSYGINVASLASLPNVVISRSKEILNALEEHHYDITTLNKEELFVNENNNFQNEYYELTDYIKRIDPLNITPLEALKILEDLKNKLK